MGSEGRQLDTASRPRQKGPNIGPFVIGDVVPDEMNDPIVRVPLLNLGQKLDGNDPINGCRFDKKCIKSFESWPHQYSLDLASQC